MKSQPSQPKRRLPARGWVVILPTLIILAVVLLLTETTSAAPSPAHPRRRVQPVDLPGAAAALPDLPPG